MIKISYPIDPIELQKFKQDYIDIFFKYVQYRDAVEDTYKIKSKLNNLGIPSIDIKILLVEDFSTLCEKEEKIDYLKLSSAYFTKYPEKDLKVEDYCTKYKSKVLKALNYEGRQAQISNFFMQNNDKLQLGTCYTCNIDFINMFDDIGDYQNSVEFCNEADAIELQKIEKIDEVQASKIIKIRNISLLTSISQLSSVLTAEEIDFLNNMTLKQQYKHFTLDHFLDKGSNPILSLSLFNFVPMCYPCNSLFKRTLPIVVDKKKDCYLSPTHKDYMFDANVSFSYINHNPTSKIDNVEDFQLKLAYKDDAYKIHSRIFKLDGRYKAHKEIVLDLHNNSIDYSETQIKEFAKMSKNNTIENRSNIKKVIFGKEIFDGEVQKIPLTKLKRDIAKQIGIDGVKET
ncbi:MAG: hypothetical protein COA44_09005 [Arcobacter sp.]|nr:MAG: hypothetical protein COA44_09005 [Arcobacter sp.]